MSLLLRSIMQSVARSVLGGSVFDGAPEYVDNLGSPPSPWRSVKDDPPSDKRLVLLRWKSDVKERWWDGDYNYLLWLGSPKVLHDGNEWMEIPE